MAHIVYKTTNLINGKFYMGVHSGDSLEYLGSGIGIKRAIKKYGKENFDREILYNFDTIEKAYEMEKLLVNNTMINRSDCYNMRGGGYGASVVTQETRNKISESHKGKKSSQETRNKISNARIGKKLSQETKDKISKAQIGENNPMFGMGKPVNRIDPITNRIITTYSSLSNAAKTMGCHISTIHRALKKYTPKGKRRKAKGYYWSYAP